MWGCVCHCCCRCRCTAQLVVRLDEQRRVPGTGAGKTLYAALLGGVPVVDVGWLTASLAQGVLLPVGDFLARVRRQGGSYTAPVRCTGTVSVCPALTAAGW